MPTAGATKAGETSIPSSRSGEKGRLTSHASSARAGTVRSMSSAYIGQRRQRVGGEEAHGIDGGEEEHAQGALVAGTRDRERGPSRQVDRGEGGDDH